MAGAFSGWCCGSCKQLNPTPYCMVGFTQVRKPYSYRHPESGYYYKHFNALGLVPCVYGITFSDINQNNYFGSIINWNSAENADLSYQFKCYISGYEDLPYWDGIGSGGPYRVGVGGTELDSTTTGDTYESCREVFYGGEVYWLSERKVADGATFGWMQIARVTDDPERQWVKTFILNPSVSSMTSTAVIFSSATSNRTWYGGSADNEIKRNAAWEACPHCVISWNNWESLASNEPGRLRYALLPKNVGAEQTCIPNIDVHHVQTSIEASIVSDRIIFLKPVLRHAPYCIGMRAVETETPDFYDITFYLINWTNPESYWEPEDGGPSDSGFYNLGGGNYAAKGWRTDSDQIVNGEPMFGLSNIEDISLINGIVIASHIRNSRIVVLLNNGTYYDSDSGIISLHADDTGRYLPSDIHIGTDGEVITANRWRVRKYVNGLSSWVLTSTYPDPDMVLDPSCYIPPRQISVKITSNDGGYCVRGFASSINIATAFTQNNAELLYPGETEDNPYITSLANETNMEWWDSVFEDHMFYDLGYDQAFPSNLNAQGIIDAVIGYGGVLTPFSGCTSDTCFCPSINYSSPSEVLEMQETDWTIGYARRFWSYGNMAPHDYWIISKDKLHVSPCRKASKFLTTQKNLAGAQFYDLYTPIEHRMVQPGIEGSSIPMTIIYNSSSMDSDMSEIVSCPLTGF